MGPTETLTDAMKSSGVPDKYIASATKMMEDGSLSLSKLKELSKAMPEVVDKLTPEGELPSDDAVRSEFSRS
jgi:uncharacterized protein YidB (DUF937 family)